VRAGDRHLNFYETRDNLQDRILFELRQAALWASYTNEGNVRLVRTFMWLQLLASVFTGVAGVYSMLRGLGGS